MKSHSRGQVIHDAFATLHASQITRPLQSNLYKIRLANSAKNQGKRSGYRIITYYINKSETVFLVDIYDKSNTSSISKEELVKIIKDELH